MSAIHRSPGFNPSGLPDASTVFVVDSDASVREALDPVIRDAGWLPGLFASAEEFLAQPRLMRPACLLTELRLPGLTALDLQGLIAERKELPIIFMSEHIDVRSAIQAMKGGAFEIVTKPLATHLLLTTMRCAIERSRSALQNLAKIRMLQDRYASLSDREREVMGLLVSGRLNKQVGSDLGITEFTVKAHRGRMMRKMRAGSFAELVTMVENLRRWTETMAESIQLPQQAFAANVVTLRHLSAPATTGRATAGALMRI